MKPAEQYIKLESELPKLKSKLNETERQLNISKSLLTFSCIRYGVIDDDESNLSYWIFPVTVDDDEIKACLLNAYGDIFEAEHNTADYSPTGRWYSNGVNIERRNKRVIVTLSRYFDC